MPITDISVTDLLNFANGYEFGAAGAYVRIKGVARGTLDPQEPANQVVVDLDKAPRNAAGRGRRQRAPPPLPCHLARPRRGAADLAPARSRPAARTVARGVGIRRRADDPPVAGRAKVRADQHLRAVVRGDRRESARHRLC